MPLILQIEKNICLVCKTNRESEHHEIVNEVTFTPFSAVPYWGEFHLSGEKCFQGPVLKGIAH